MACTRKPAREGVNERVLFLNAARWAEEYRADGE
jgi:hypothetical protein